MILFVFGYMLLGCTSAFSMEFLENSVLQKGRWVKIRIEKDGMYRLSFQTLKQLGFQDPTKINVYGYGGYILPESFSEKYVDDLPATPVIRTDQAILFYGRATIKWKYDEKTGVFSHEQNPYSRYGYYFITESSNLHDAEEVDLQLKSGVRVEDYDDFLLHEKEMHSPNRSGRYLYGEDFSFKTNQFFPFDIQGITNAPGKITLSFISRPKNDAMVVLSANQKRVLSGYFDSRDVRNSSYPIYLKALPLNKTADWIGDKNAKTEINISYSNKGDENVYLDFIRLQFKRSLQFQGDQISFRNVQSIRNDVTYYLKGVEKNNVMIADVSSPNSIFVIKGTKENQTFSFSTKADGTLHEYIAFNPDKLPEPEVLGTVVNQNLHASEQAEMVILTPYKFWNEAQRLANAHRSLSGLSVLVVPHTQIFNEFSSGTPDATAYRLFLKMLYDRAQKGKGPAPRYLLLFGDGAFDNRMLSQEWSRSGLEEQDFLLTFQSKQSLNINTYVTDDYYGFLEDGEGLEHISDVLNVGVGRFPVRTLEEAHIVVNKTIAYLENKHPGFWKNRVCFVADDGDNNIHMSQAESLASWVEEARPEYLVKRIYLDTYKEKTVGGQTGYPDATVAIKRSLNDGQLLLNYTGHGNTTAWAQEQVLKNNDISNFSYSALPLWITASCDFARFDDLITSAGEKVFLNPHSGGIALFTTSRVSFSGPNIRLNRELIKNIFATDEGKNNALGDILRRTKMTQQHSNKLNFTLLGDPALRLGTSMHSVKVLKINGKEINESMPNLNFKPLEKIKIEGEVVDDQGQVLKDFNGSVTINVLDGKVEVVGLNNKRSGAGPFKYQEYQNTLFIGKSNVAGGRFSLEFMVPKDISYRENNGKMVFYSLATDGKEANGFFNQFVLLGKDTQDIEDKEGPEITAMYLNDSTFVEGSKVNDTPLFVAQFKDASGINISGNSVGHDITLMIDDSPINIYNLNSFFEPVLNEQNKGEVRFVIPKLEQGVHKATLRVWDIMNNSTTKTILFEVDLAQKPTLKILNVFPSPAKQYVTFEVATDWSQTEMSFVIQVFDMAGNMVWHKEEMAITSFENPYSTNWNLSYLSGGRVPAGIYIYRVSIKTLNQTSVAKTGKMIVLAQ